MNYVASILLHYFIEILSTEVTHLQLFCDSCPGQNKNWTMLRFFHYMVHQKKRFANIKLSFLIREHSYMECDQDMIVINQKFHIDTPTDWRRHFKDARKSPSPFHIISVENTMLLNIEKNIKTLYFTSSPIQTQPPREIVISKIHPDKIIYRDSWNGPFHFCKLDAQEFYDYLLHERDGQSSPVNDYSDFDDEEEIKL